MEKINSKNKYSPSADAALIERVAMNDQLPFSIQNVLQLADQFCHNNNSQQEVQLCALTLHRMLENIKNEFLIQLQHEQLETLQRKILMRFGDCQLSKSTRRMCGEIIGQLLFLSILRHSYRELNPTGHDIDSLPWPNLFDQLLQVADDESQDTTLRCMSLIVFAENMEELYRFSRDKKFSDRHQLFAEIVKRWLDGSNVDFAIAAAECACRSFKLLQWNRDHLSPPQVVIAHTAFGDIVLRLLRAYRNACDVDEYDAEKQTKFPEHIRSFFHTENLDKVFEDPNQFQQLCESFMSICRRNVGENREIVDVLCTIMLNLMESNSIIHEFIASTPGEITKLFNFFVDLMCRWLEVEYDAEAWPRSFRPLSEDGCDLEELYGFDRAADFVYNLNRIFDGKEVANLMAQMLERILDNSENNNNNNNTPLSASQKVPFNSAASTFQQNNLLNNKHPQWMVSASVLWCFGGADQALFDRLAKKMYALLNTFVLPTATNHHHPFVRYSALYSTWRLHCRNMLPLDDSDESQFTHKRFLEILASKMRAAEDCFRVQEIAGVAISHVFDEDLDSNSDNDSTENISDLQKISLPNVVVQSIFDSLSNHESEPNFVISSHLRGLADVCDKTSSDHPLKLNDQLLPLLQHLVQKYHSILLQEIESSSNNNNDGDDDDEESEFSRKARLDPSFKFDVLCLANSIRAASRVFEFLPYSDEIQTVAKELTSFVVEMLETLQLRVKDEILRHLLDALGFLCTRLGKNNFPNDCGGADLVDRMMPPLIHYAMLDHLIPTKHDSFTDEVSDEIVKVKQAAVDIMCRLCRNRGELMKQKWASSIGDIIIHLMETEGESLRTMHKMGFDLFVAVGNAIGHPTQLYEADELVKLANKHFVGDSKNNNNVETEPTNEETSKPDPEEWKFLTKVANRVTLRFLGLKKVLALENAFPIEHGITDVSKWTSNFGPNLPHTTSILVACLLPHISPAIWEQFAELILSQIIRMVRTFDSVRNSIRPHAADNMNEFEKQYTTVMEKATTLQARRQQEEQRRQQQILAQVGSNESGSRREREEDADDDAQAREEEELRENQLHDDVLVLNLKNAKQGYINNNDDDSFDESLRAVRKCLKIALAGIPTSRVAFMWRNNNLKNSLKDLIVDYLGRDLLGLRLNDWSGYFDRYYQFADRFLAQDAERGTMKNNNSSSSHPASLPLKTRLELIMPTTPSFDLSFVLSRTTQVPRMMKSVLESDLLNALLQLPAESQSGTPEMTVFILLYVDSSWTKIISLIQKFKFVPLPEHSGADALKFVLDRNAELSLELDKILFVMNIFGEFFMRNLEPICKSEFFLRDLAKALRARHDRNDFFDKLEKLAQEKPKLFIKMYVALQCKATLGVVGGLFNIFPHDLDDGRVTLSEDTFEFAESYLSFNMWAVVNLILEPTRHFVEADDDEGATDEERNLSLEYVDASAQILLQKLTKYEIFFIQYQEQQIAIENRKNETDPGEERNENNREEDAAEKSESTELSGLWITRVKEKIENLISHRTEKQLTTEN